MYGGVDGYTACVRVGHTVTKFGDKHNFATGALIGPDNGEGGSCAN